jgi:hypothetical protein
VTDPSPKSRRPSPSSAERVVRGQITSKQYISKLRERATSARPARQAAEVKPARRS